MKSFPGASHMGILQDQRLIDEILRVVMGSSRAKTLGPSWGTWPDLLGAAITGAVGRLVS